MGILFAALAVGSGAIYSSFLRPPTRATAGDPNAPPEFVANWEQLEKVGIQTGEATAPVKIFEFTDLECPFCAKYEATLRAVSQKYPDRVSRIIVHFPLSMHSSSREAAKALECAADQRVTEAMLHELYSRQAEFVRKPWMAAAQASGIADSARFADCMSVPSAPPRVEQGYQVATKMEVGGTPTVLINGYLFPSPPSDSTLERVIEAIIQGKSIPGVRSKKPTRRVSLQ